MNVYKTSKIDFCIGFKKLNLKRNKYIIKHVHYAIQERDWESILEKCNISARKIYSKNCVSNALSM